MRTEARLKQWEAEHGFPGIYSITGRDINRKCGCGKRTKTLHGTENGPHGGK